MPIPEVKRVKYKKCPLENVVCQLRFSPILKIDSEAPYKFQEAIRSEFPIYKETIEVQRQINLNCSNPIENPLSSSSTSKNYEFASEDGKWKLNLTRTFLALTTSDYQTWEVYIKKLTKPLQALIKEYKLDFFTRVGLRYVDVFCRSDLGLEHKEWKDLIEPQFLGLLGSDLSNSVQSYNSVNEIMCENGSTVLKVASNIVKKVSSNEECFLLDSDIYTIGNTKVNEFNEKIDYMHARTSRLMRYAIKKLLHESMEPEVIE